jgi:GT2 family glycosyltransferase
MAPVLPKAVPPLGVPLAFRPRSMAEQRQLAETILSRGESKFPLGDDGWETVALTIAGVSTQPATVAEFATRVLHDYGLSASSPTLHKRMKVCILICTFNRRNLLPHALTSAIAQQWPGEIVVVNDGSSDGTKEYLEAEMGAWRSTETELIVVEQTNQGKSRALQAGLAQSRAEAVLILDDDDVLLPGAISALATTLADNPTSVVALGDLIAFREDQQGQRQVVTVRPSLRAPNKLFEHAWSEMPAFPGSTLFRRSALDAAGAFDPNLTHIEDLDMILRVGAQGPACIVPFPTLLYRVHDGLRGPEADRFTVHTTHTHRERMLPQVRQLLIRHASNQDLSSDRQKKSAQAMGFVRRGLPVEAMSCLGGPPYTEREQWIRKTAGQAPGPLDTSQPSLLVIDDGGIGALEAALERHASRRRLFVRLLVPRDPLSDLLLHWQGNFTVASSPAPLLPRGPFGLVFTSAPELVQEGFQAPVDLLPGDLRTASEILWLCRTDLPKVRFGTDPQPDNGLLGNILTIRTLRGESPGEALAFAKRLLSLLPSFPPLYEFVGILAKQAGDLATAQRVEQQARALRQTPQTR